MIESKFSRSLCARISVRDGLATQVDVAEEGLKHESSIHCMRSSAAQPLLTDYVASLKPARLRVLDQALRVALALA